MFQKAIQKGFYIMKKKILLLSILAALAGTMTGCSVSLNQGSGAAASRAGAGKTQESVRTDIVDDDEADAGTDTDGTTDPDEGDSAADESAAPRDTEVFDESGNVNIDALDEGGARAE